MRLRIDATLSECLVAGGLDEFRELGVRHFVLIDPEAIEFNLVAEAFLRPLPV
jgi:hypothetical protein